MHVDVSWHPADGPETAVAVWLTSHDVNPDHPDQECAGPLVRHDLDAGGARRHHAGADIDAQRSAQVVRVQLGGHGHARRLGGREDGDPDLLVPFGFRRVGRIRWSRVRPCGPGPRPPPAPRNRPRSGRTWSRRRPRLHPPRIPAATINAIIASARSGTTWPRSFLRSPRIATNLTVKNGWC